MKTAFLFIALFSITLLSFSLAISSDTPVSVKKEAYKIYKFNIKEEIGPGIWRQTQQALAQADSLKADYIFIEMNTYGGLVDAADNIRTAILNSKIPVIVLIENNAASAGALIAIACDSIYMQPGSTIGAATVVDQTGQAVPDKYQSYMRKKMRATAERNGRDPLIAEAMVDPDVYIPGIIDSGKVLTFSTTEAIKYNYCEAELSSFEEVMKHIGISDYEVTEYIPSSIEKTIGFLVNPAISGILIMIIIAGIYFELQTPGVGFPLIAAIIAAVLYFAPLYLEGLAANWEILLFIAGIGLLLVEIFVIPGFGVAGVSGIALIILGLTLSMINNIGFDFTFSAPDSILQSFLTVIISAIIAISGSLYFGGKLVDSPLFQRVVLASSQESAQGYSSADSSLYSLIGKTGITQTILRPSGKIAIEGELYDAMAQTSYIEKGMEVRVVGYESAQLIVRIV